MHYLFLKLDRHAIDDRSRTDEVCHLTCLAGLLHEAGEGGACLAGQPCLQQFLKETVNVFVRHVPQVSQHARAEKQAQSVSRCYGNNANEKAKYAVSNPFVLHPYAAGGKFGQYKMMQRNPGKWVLI